MSKECREWQAWHEPRDPSRLKRPMPLLGQVVKDSLLAYDVPVDGVDIVQTITDGQGQNRARGKSRRKTGIAVFA